MNMNRRTLLAAAAAAFTSPTAANAGATAYREGADLVLNQLGRNIDVRTALTNDHNWGWNGIIMPHFDCYGALIAIKSEKWGGAPTNDTGSEHYLTLVAKDTECTAPASVSLYRSDDQSYLLPTDNWHEDPTALAFLEAYFTKAPSIRVNNLTPEATAGAVSRGPMAYAEAPYSLLGNPTCSPLNARDAVLFEQHKPFLSRVVEGRADPHSFAILLPLGSQDDGRQHYQVSVMKKTQPTNGTIIFAAEFSMADDDGYVTRTWMAPGIGDNEASVAIGMPHTAGAWTQSKVTTNYAGPSYINWRQIRQDFDENYR